jgi:KUP system potassium uptake protein
MTSHAATAASPGVPARAGLWTLTLGSIGVVYGDIGTSPLYALKESVSAAAAGGAPTREMVFGVVSLMLWALIVVVTVKYVLFILRAGNNGEGGTPALMAHLQRVMARHAFFIVLLGIAGAALFYGDAMITPAISVLSAVEGLKVFTPALEPFVLPLSLAILVGLFAVQSRGTAAVAAWFGPITSVWFVCLAIGGLSHLAADASILAAANPVHGVRFLLTHGHVGLLALGAVFLTVTGAEALYADMGHFGRKPIQTAWLAFVFPALAINYLGQGALVLARPEALENPFFLLYPEWALLPMVGLATAATIIASQAVITGAYSMTQQLIQLGLLPRMEVRRTSETETGQIYIPVVNWLLLLFVVFLILVFKSSSAFASAYGVAVTGTMVVTTTMAFLVAWKCWRWSLTAAALVVVPFLAIDLTFLFANLLKVVEGGWIPLAVGAALMAVMLTWRRGTRVLAEKTRKDEVPLSDVVAMLAKSAPERVKGTAVFLTGDPESTPRALLHNLKHNKVLHEQNVVLHVVTDGRPRLDDRERASVERLSDDFWRVTLRFGFMETPDVTKALVRAHAEGLKIDLMQTSFFLARRALRTARKSPMPRWQERLFIGLARSANDASRYFGIPSGRVIELGAQIAV